MAKRALGKGLSALIGESVAPQRSNAGGGDPAPAAAPMLGDREAVMLPVGVIEANPHQPRKVMDTNALEELAQSIRANGVLQPILVRKVGTGFELVAGERRLRASKIAGREDIPALVCTMEESESLKLALLENIQRENLNAIEEAEAYREIMEHYGATHQELADLLGKNRSTVTNTLRLLGLQRDIQDLVAGGDLSMGHARALLAVEDPGVRQELATKAVKQAWPVRALEREIQAFHGAGRKKAPKPKAQDEFDANTAALREFERRLQQHLGSPVAVKRQGKKGRVEIAFFSDDEFLRVLERIGVDPQL